MGDSILSTNHRERERQIKNISRVPGEKVEKKIYVQMEDLDEKKKDKTVKLERENKNKRSDHVKKEKKPLVLSVL